ncbi:hypothetical protein RB597_001621 [Gaeumannomyces tritici]
MKPFSAFGALLAAGVASSAAVQPAVDAGAVTVSHQLNGRGVMVSSEEFSSLYQFAKYAGAAYCAPNAKIGDPVFCKGEICPGRNATILATFAGRITDILGFLAEDPDSQTLTVSIRGSRTIQNFITDVIFRAQAADREFCAGCTVHAGFMYAHQEIVARVRAAVADALDEYPNHRVRLTGHSLGGAVATLLGATLRRRGVACDIYTYGAPRVGNEAFVRWVDAQDNGRLLRLTHYNDLVPQLPPIFLNYRHTSPELWLGSGPVNRNGYLPGDVVECPGSANVLCNAASWDTSIAAHLHYLLPISYCGSWKSMLDMTVENGTDELNSTDPALAERLGMFAQLDKDYAEALDEDGGIPEDDAFVY